MTNRIEEIAKKISNHFMRVEDDCSFVEAALEEVRTLALKEAAKIAAEYIEIERERASDEYGHIKSLALGAMESAEAIKQDILALIPESKEGE